MTEKDNEFEKLINEKVVLVKAASQNYIDQMKVIAHEMSMTSKHGTIIGSFREEAWIELFRRILPKKFSIANSVIIIDSYGRMSNEVDIAIYDENYTPYIMHYGSIKLIPIEAVAVVVECKSTSYDDDKLIDWANSIKQLKTSCSGLARMATGYIKLDETNAKNTQTNCRPIRIFAPLKQVSDKSKIRDYFDIILSLDIKNNNEESLDLDIPNDKKTLGWWAEVLNKNPNSIEYNQPLTDFSNKVIDNSTLLEFEVKENPLLTLNFQLNQLLMLINNPMLFPHKAYVKLFNDPETVIRQSMK